MPASAAPEPAVLLERLRASIGALPWNPGAGYRLEGRFTLKLAGDEVFFAARFERRAHRWAARFAHADPARAVTFLSDRKCWASTVELTAPIVPQQIPFTTAYDFPGLWSELERILGGSNARIQSDHDGIYVRGRLRDGSEATFLFNDVQYLPRKVSIQPAARRPAWTMPALEPDASARVVFVPSEPSERFELWFSDFVSERDCRYPRRTDYAGRDGVAATFELERAASEDLKDDLFEVPARLPWADTLSFRAGGGREPRLYLSSEELPAFRSRLAAAPWSAWRRTNAMAAAWGLLAVPLAAVFPGTPSPRALGVALTLLPLAALFLLIRRRRQFGRRRVSPRLVLCCVLVWLGILLGGAASIQLSTPEGRAGMALQGAIRYTVTGNAVHARLAAGLLHGLPDRPAPSSMRELGASCGTFALAYDLIRGTLSPERRARAEQDLFDYARPLFGALQGWRSITAEAGTMATGLGLAGMATGCEPFTEQACRTIDRILDLQMSSGLHREGPAAGVRVLDSLANLFHALARSGRADYYRHPSVVAFVRTTAELLSPVGTLPLFSGAGLDEPALGGVLLKLAGRMPDPAAGRASAAWEAYRQAGRHSGTGFARVADGLWRPHSFFLENPFVLFLHDGTVAARAAGSSAVAGEGRIAVLRSGAGPSALYLALSAQPSLWMQPRGDVLAFDLYGYSGLLLHGPGRPAADRSGRELSARTGAFNTVTFDGAGQSQSGCSGVLASLINQAVFDYVRVAADKTYDLGQLQRDVVLVRPGGRQPGYFVLVDEIQTADQRTQVQWFLHGRGKLNRGVDQVARWTSRALAPPGFRSAPEVSVLAFSFGATSMRSQPGTLYSRSPWLTEHTESLILEWTGSRRFPTVLIPRGPGVAEPSIQAVGQGAAGRIGESDWISLGEPESRRTTGPLSHISEYVIARDRNPDPPAFLMISGVEFRMGGYRLAADKPVTLSMDGLDGGLLATRPRTRIEIHSPAIRASDRFLLDGATVIAAEEGAVVLLLESPGEHSLRHESRSRPFPPSP